MKTPAYTPFIKSVGKTVHHLNTIAVGLAGVESGDCTKPGKLDVSWNPIDLRASSRDARSFTLESTIVFVAEELCEYNSKIINSPNVGEVSLKSSERSIKHEALSKHLSITPIELSLGPLLLIHWRNRIIHKKSKASLTGTQKKEFTNVSETVREGYKNLCINRLLNDFDRKRPTIKDVSSLIAMTINYVKLVEKLIPEPSSIDDFICWLNQLDLYEQFERAKRVSANKPKPEQAMQNFILTNCPELLDCYVRYYE